MSKQRSPRTSASLQWIVPRTEFGFAVRPWWAVLLCLTLLWMNTATAAASLPGLHLQDASGLDFEAVATEYASATGYSLESATTAPTLLDVLGRHTESRTSA